MNNFVPQQVQSKGKTIDEAITNGLKELGFSIDEVSIETIQLGSKGIFGFGSKPCIVKLTQKNNIFDYSSMDFEEKPKEPESLLPKKVLDSKTFEKKQKPAKITNEPAKITPVAAFEETKQQEKKQSLQTQQKPPIRRTPIEYKEYIEGGENCECAEFVFNLLQKMDIQAKLKFASTENMQKVKIESESMGMLIGHRGETLDAMQYLASLVVNRGREHYLRITVDTENYRVKREETLIRLARKLASQVKSTGKKIELEPMNPYERRILHATLQNNPEIQTHSLGEEPNRRVVIAPRIKK